MRYHCIKRKQLGLVSGVHNLLKHRRQLFIIATLFVTIFCLAAYTDVPFKISARLNVLDSKTFFHRMCPSPRYSPVNLPTTALASFPGSGNTWLRYLVQEASGILTGSEYNDTELLENAFPAEGITNTSTILVKTHGSNSKTRERYSRVVLLVRHPKDTILAEFNRNYGGGHSSVASERSYIKYWRPFLNIHARAWYNFHRDWLRYKKPLLIVLYQDMVTDTLTQLKRVSTFLKFSTSSRKLDCALYTAKHFKRIKSRYEPRVFYDHKMLRYLDTIYNNTLRNIDKLLRGGQLK